MTEGVSQAAGIGPTIELGGERIFVKGRVIRSYGLMEAAIVKKRVPTPLDMVRAIKDDYRDEPEMFEIFARIAIREAKTWSIVTSLELAHWVQQTMDGFIFMVWLSIRDNDPSKWTFERTRDLVCDKLAAAASNNSKDSKDNKSWRAEVEAAIDQASGEDELGN